MAQHERRASDDFSEVSSLHEGMSQEVSRQEAPPEPDHLKSHLSTRQYESPDPTNSTQTSLGKEQQRDDQSNLGFAKPLDTQFLGFWLMLLYIFAAIVSWTVTCILSYRPIALPGSIGGLSYDDQSGTIYSKNWTYSERWRQAASIGSAVVAAVGIPVTSAICAKATAVYCERRSKAQRPSLTLRQTIALADHGWSDLGVIRNLFRPSTSRRTRSRLLVVSTGLAGLALVIPVLQSALVRSVHIQVSFAETKLQILGSQTPPWRLPYLNPLFIIPSVMSATLDTNLGDKQPFIWLEGAGASNQTSTTDKPEYSSDLAKPTSQLFVAGWPIGTDTGMLRELATRLNSSVNCEIVPQSSFPSSCQGNNPFNKSYTNIDNTTSSPFSDAGNPKFQARFCAPGDMLASPWKSDTGDRQDITEELYLDFQSTNFTNRIKNFTQHCTAQTSLGHFELPNYWNGHVASPLLSILPPQKGPNETFYGPAYPQPLPNLPFSYSSQIPGPFLTSVLAIFGNDTFFDAVASHSNYADSDGLLCRHLRQPFVGLGTETQTLWGSALFNASNPVSTTAPICEKLPGQTSNDSLLLNALLDWFPNFGNVESATAAFTLAISSANTALLNDRNDVYGYGWWLIWSSSGFSVQKPTISSPAIVTISVLLSLQVAGLAWIAILGLKRPTWTRSLDAFALLRMGAALHKEMPLISSMKAGELELLDEKPGWIGGDGPLVRAQNLVIGGPDEVVPDRRYRMVENEHDWVMEEKKEISGWKRLLWGRDPEMMFEARHEHSYRRLRKSATEDDVADC